MAKQYIVGGLSFATKAEIQAHARAVLYTGPTGSVVDGEDFPFVNALFHARSDKLAELNGLVVVAYWRDLQDGPIKRTACFWAELENGKRIDFSFKKAITMMPTQ
jgi:hypothetical protein